MLEFEATRLASSTAASSHLLDLGEVQLNRRRSAEDGDRDADLGLVVVDFFNRAIEVGERAFLDAHDLADRPLDLRTRLFDAFLHLVDDLHDLGLGDRRGAVLRTTNETGHLGGVLHQVPGLVVHRHLDQHITREEAAFGHGLLAVLQLDDLFGRHQDAAELVLHAGAVDALAQVALHRLLHAGVGMHDIPALGQAGRGFARDDLFFRHSDSLRSALPAQDQVVQHPFQRLVGQPQEERHHDDKGKHVARHLRRFLAGRPDDLLDLTGGVTAVGNQGLAVFRREKRRDARREQHDQGTPLGQCPLLGQTIVSRQRADQQQHRSGQLDLVGAAGHGLDLGRIRHHLSFTHRPWSGFSEAAKGCRHQQQGPPRSLSRADAW
mmetsp:Transcript_23362/g.55499  ORF Transcript_23362/g.55499 Transcript_23362/m.55499 type:complete len:379 (+) Transcript_23362:11344-12480(+)